MNKHIKELAVQAGISFIPYMDSEGDHPDAIHNLHLARFAELIVKECAEVAANHVGEIEGVDFGLVKVCHTHFGITE